MLEYLEATTQVLVALAALGAFILSWRNNNRIEEAKKSIQEVHLTFNSRMGEFIELAKETSLAKGVKQERDRQKAEDDK